MSLEKYKKFSIQFLLPALLTSVLFCFSSLFWTTDDAYSIQDKKEIKLGFPIPFISFDQSRWDGHDFSRFPERSGIILEAPASFIWIWFILNLVIVQNIMTVMLFFLRIYYPRTESFLKYFSVKNIIVICSFIFMGTLIYIFGGSLYVRHILL